MLKTVIVTNHHGERYELPLSNPEESGFLIKNITGMGPVNTSINTSSGALSPGEFFNSSKIQKRNIVIDLIYYPEGQTVEELRLLAYRMFEVNTPIDVEFYTDHMAVVAHGYVESQEPTIFAEQCEVSISILCPDPFLYALGETQYSMSDLLKNFTFSFFNPDPLGETKTIEDTYYDGVYYDESTSVPDSTLVFGTYDTSAMKTIHNKGNISGVGLDIEIVIKDSGLSNFIFGNYTRDEMLKLDDDMLGAIVPNGLQNGDVITISSVRGKKSLIFKRLNQILNILPAKVYNSDWIYLDSGDNDVYYSCDAGSETIDVTLRYTEGYAGV